MAQSPRVPVNHKETQRELLAPGSYLVQSQSLQLCGEGTSRRKTSHYLSL